MSNAMSNAEIVRRLRDVADSAVTFGIYENETKIWRAAADELERLRGDIDQALRRAESAERLCGDYIARMERMKELVCSDCAQVLGGQGK